MIKPFFRNIRKKIIENINLAENEISVAIYWFTNQELFDILCLKLSQGKTVTLIIHNDYINNRSTGLNFQRFIDLGGTLYFSDAENPMHNKFCIIDDKILINGSYNWTYYAEDRNNENVLIIDEEIDLINSFRSEFIRLTERLVAEKEIRQLSSFEIDEYNGLSSKEYLAADIIFEAKATNRPEIVESAFQLIPDNVKIQEVAVGLGLTKKRKIKVSIGASLKDDKYLVGVEKGTILPITISKILSTSIADQTSCQSLIFFGEHETASHNVKLKSISLNKQSGGVKLFNIPKKPLGEAKMKMIFSIDIYGHLRVRFYSLDNGVTDYLRANIDSLIEESY